MFKVCLSTYSAARNDGVLHHRKPSFCEHYIRDERQCLTTFPNTEKRVEITTRSEVFLTNFEVFGNLVKHCLECLIYLLNRN